MTEAQIAEAVRLVKPDDGDNDVLRQIVGKSLVQWKLKELGKDDISQKRFGFYVGTSSENDIENRAEEEGIILSDAIWHSLNADIHTLERNACDVLRKNNISCNPESHDDNSLIGSAWIESYPDPTQTSALPSAKALKMVLFARNDFIGTYDESFEEFDPEKKIWDGVSSLGQKLIDVSISFLNTEELNLDDWDEVHQAHPEMWGLRNEAKEYFLPIQKFRGKIPV